MGAPVVAGEIGRRAAEMVVDRLNGREVAPIVVEQTFEIVKSQPEYRN